MTNTQNIEYVIRGEDGFCFDAVTAKSDDMAVAEAENIAAANGCTVAVYRGYAQNADLVARVLPDRGF